jgi:hypothetical protein
MWRGSFEMHSPLELAPEFVAKIGLINVRWSALDKGLAELLGRFLRVDHAGEAALFAIGSFSQRMQLLLAISHYSIEEELHTQILESLLHKIDGLWKQRNLFVHSHYVHKTTYKNGIEVVLMGDGGHPFTPEAIDSGDRPIVNRSFGYLKHQRNKSDKFVPINKGALSNHAQQVARRGRQIMVVVKAIDTGIIGLKKDAPTKYQKISPRAQLKAERLADTLKGPFTSRVIEIEKDKSATSYPTISSGLKK